MKNLTKRITTIAMLILLVSVLTTPCPANNATTKDSPLVLVSDGKANAVIVVPENADSWTMMAAGWVKEYVEKVSGAQLQIVPETNDLTGPRISVGHTQLAQQAGVTTDKLKFDGCKMLVKDNVLFLVGRDVAPLEKNMKAIPNPQREPWDYMNYIFRGYKAPAKAGAKGTCRAATLFIEDICGVRWLAPSAKGTYIPNKTTIAVPANLDKTFEPWMAYHSNRLLYGDPLSEPAAYANNYRLAIKLYTHGGHTYPTWVPMKKYFKDHPEYFIMTNGKRASGGNHICATNPEARNLILKGVTGRFDAGYDLVQLGQSDGYIACECDNCLALSNTSGARNAKGQLIIEHPGEPMLDLARWLAEQTLEEYPGRYIHMLVYGPTGDPPKTFKTFPPNIMFEFASSGSPELIRRWQGRSTSGGTVYTPWHWTDYGIGIGMKMGYREAADIMKQYHELGITGVHGSGGQCWGLQGPTYYSFGKMMGDPTLDVEMLLEEYCRGLFGPAADEMMAFFRELHKVSDHSSIAGRSPEMTATDRFPIQYPPARLKKLDDLLKAAEAAADTQHHKNWVQTTRDEFDYIRLVANALAVYKQYKITQDPGLISKVRKAVDIFDEYRKRIVNYDGQYAFDYFPGHGILSIVLAHGQGGGGYGSDWREIRKRVNFNDLSGADIGQSPNCIDKPFTLDFDQADIEGAFKLVYTKEAPKADGKLDEPQWQNAPPTYMRGAAQTEIRGLYDDENLYISYLCEEPTPDGPTAWDIEKDQPIAYMYLVEFFVDPTSSVESSTFYHFLTGATPNAMMDHSQGFDGNMMSQDLSWDSPGFRYGFSKDLEKKQWIIEMVIPLKDIGATAPKDGDVWMGNHARQGGDLYQWSKSGTPGFCHPKSFNKFRFVRQN